MATHSNAWRAAVRQHTALESKNQEQQAQIDAMRPVVEAVATSRSVFAELDVWVLLLENSTVSYLQELVTQARAFVAAHPTAGVTFADTDGSDPDAYDEAESEA